MKFRKKQAEHLTKNLIKNNPIFFNENNYKPKNFQKIDLNTSVYVWHFTCSKPSFNITSKMEVTNWKNK